MNTVDVRIPDVRFAKPDINLSGYRMSRFRTSESQFSKCPDFGQRSITERSKSGHYCPDFRHLEPVLNPKPLPNRFQTSLELVLGLKCLKSGRLCPDFERSVDWDSGIRNPNIVTVNGPDVWNPDKCVRLSDSVWNPDDLTTGHVSKTPKFIISIWNGSIKYFIY